MFHLLVCLPLVSGWGQFGHKIVALIAGNFIDKETMEYLENTLDMGGRGVPESIAHHSVWADIMCDKYEWLKPLHFAYTEDYKCSPFDFQRDCDNGRCIVSALGNYTMRASDPTLPDEEREEAVKFIVHFMADIHQPLHFGNRVDEGGTKIELWDPATTLHEVWDSYFIDIKLEKIKPKNLSPNALWTYYELYKKMMSIETHEYNALKAKYEVKMSSSDLGSCNAMIKVIGDIGSETTSKVTCPLAYKDLKGNWIEDDDVLKGDWFDSRMDAALEQLKKAGIRLAQLLRAVARAYNRNLKYKRSFLSSSDDEGEPYDQRYVCNGKDVQKKQVAPVQILTSLNKVSKSKKSNSGSKNPVSKKSKKKQDDDFTRQIEEFKAKNPELYAVEAEMPMADDVKKKKKQNRAVPQDPTVV